LHAISDSRLPSSECGGEEPFISRQSISSIFAQAGDFDDEMPEETLRVFHWIAGASAPVEDTYCAAVTWLSRRSVELSKRHD
jgi:hypothetical protein